MANHEQAVNVCRILELVAPNFGAHVALTGGCLYKDGERKDIDVLFYRIRQEPQIDQDGLFSAMTTIGFLPPSGMGWCYKTKYNGISIDMFFPEEQGGEYNGGSD